MKPSFFWYDLETSGFNPREQRIMQFAGQRTTLALEPIGEPVNVFIKLTNDVLPDPDAVLVTGITPQATIADGLTEAEFLKLFTKEVALPGTIFAGYNSIRFDDEFVRFLNYRNFYDAYEWQWKDNRSRWDLLDVVRMTRALRPDGIKWPFDSSGKPSNRLELLTSLNGLDHENAHDALSDVQASIALATLIRDKQPKLFDFLLELRSKQAVEKFLKTNNTFVYTSGKYASEFEKTTVVGQLMPHPKRSGATLVYDLRHDPTPFLKLSAKELVTRWQWTKDENAPPRLPVKTLRHNVCPAMAPLSVLDVGDTKQRLQIDLETMGKHRQEVQSDKTFLDNLVKAIELMDKQQQTSAFANPQEVDGLLYDDFLDDPDRKQLEKVQSADPKVLTELVDSFHDKRLKELLPLYKARNFPKALTDEERKTWEAYRLRKLTAGGQNSRLAKFLRRLQELAASETGGQKQYLLEELQLYAESIMPLDDGA